jgi:GH15 family glucan-1,4-alpha-glucosidase
MAANLSDRALPIEDYAMIGDRLTAALVGRDGSIDWLCLPRFDSAACFAALLGEKRHGHWRIAPQAEATVKRAYHDNSLVLETIFTTHQGSVALIDFMPLGLGNSHVVRLVQGRRGHVAMLARMALRFDYGMSVPWVTRLPDESGLQAICGPDQVVLRTPVEMRGEDMTTVGEFTVREGQTIPFVLSHTPSHLPPAAAIDPIRALDETNAAWRDFIRGGQRDGVFQKSWQPAVDRSLLTLRALTYGPTGGIVAAPTTSLPEQLGGGRNWDYRYCWLRDATLVLFALMNGGYTDEAAQWRDWLHRSVAGSPAQLQIMYGLHGERRLDEWEVAWLPGYQGASPVRVGNAASGQVQLDVYGEVMECLHQARVHGLASAPHGWSLQRGILDHLIDIWDQPDESIWEVRGGARHFTFSKIMAWVALDRMIKDAEQYHMPAELDKWRGLRQHICDTILRDGFDHEKNSFVQSFGSKNLDSSLLLIPVVGFLPPDDARVRGTLAAIERDLLVDGFVRRYKSESGVDGLAGGEGVFLACTFWLADAYALQGRHKEARALFDRLLDLRNDVGLLSEEYDAGQKRLVGNFPQAFSHVALIGAAMMLTGSRKPRT